MGILLFKCSCLKKFSAARTWVNTEGGKVAVFTFRSFSKFLVYWFFEKTCGSDWLVMRMGGVKRLSIGGFLLS